MKRKIAFLFIAMAALMIRPTSAPSVAILTNGGFEEGWHGATAYWTPGGGPYYDGFNEIMSPEGWTTWWREGFPCLGTSDWRTGRPEVRVISGPDPERIHGGARAVQWFTFWRCHDGGLLQQVEVKPGHYYALSAYAHSWYSQCSTKPHNPPLETDCVTPITWAQDYLSVGIDPTGGTDPMGSAVVWGAEREIYGIYDEPLTVGRIRALTETITVFVKSEASHPLKHVDNYWDDAILIDCTHRIFLPVAVRNVE